MATCTCNTDNTNAAKPCDPEAHKGHICVLASQKKFDLIKLLARDAKFVCFNCGRVAAAESSLCNPMPLK